jgi:hypothetical protein
MQAFMRSLSPTPAEKKLQDICSALSPLFQNNNGKPLCGNYTSKPYNIAPFIA